MENIDFVKENNLVVNADEISLFLEQNQVRYFYRNPFCLIIII